MSAETIHPGSDMGEFSPGGMERVTRRVRDGACCVGISSGCDDAPGVDPPLKSPSGAFSANPPAVPAEGAGTPPATGPRPDAAVAALAAAVGRMELAWLNDQSTAPHDDLCCELLSRMPLDAAAVQAVVTGRNARFLSALLLRGVSRLWTCGPAANPQKP